LPLSMHDRIESLQRTAHAWLAFKRLLDAIPDADLERPNEIGVWSGRDVVVHVATWEDEALRVIAHLDAGLPERWPDHSGAARDAWNAAQLAPFRALSTAEIRVFSVGTHAELMLAAEQSPVAGPSVAMRVTEGHTAEHLAQLRELRQRYRVPRG
jgi:hypothetical protein